MLAVGGLAAAALAQQDDGLVLASGEQVPIGGLSHAVDVGRRVLPPAALEHLHHLGTEEKSESGDTCLLSSLGLFGPSARCRLPSPSTWRAR